MNENKEDSNFDRVSHFDTINEIAHVPLYVEKSFITLLKDPEDAKISIKIGSLDAEEIHLKLFQKIPIEPGDVVFVFSNGIYSHEIRFADILDLDDHEESTK